ncbi:MAG: DUF839 domain-containing protein [Chloroflexaceae bacterium]|nr:DUF839 domain-containing protein [Chloroflexaceae bacterium]
MRLRLVFYVLLLALIAGQLSILSVSIIPTEEVAAQSLKATKAVTDDPPYVRPIAAGVSVRPLLTVGETVPMTGSPNADYRMIGIPDGLGAYKMDNGNVRLFMNHELNFDVISAPFVDTLPTTRTGALVSEFVLSGQQPINVKSGDLAFDTVFAWEGPDTGFVDRTQEWLNGENTFARFCSGYMAGPHSGLEEYIYLNGEETSAAFGTFDSQGGQAVAFVDNAAWLLPEMGRFAKENIVVVPGTGQRTVVLALEDGPSSLDSQLYVYIGQKDPNATTAVERAGLVGGKLYFFRSTDLAKNSELTFRKADGTLTGEWVAVDSTLEDGEEVWNLLDDTLNERVQAANPFNVIRVEDAAYDRNEPGVVYFTTTGSDYVDPITGRMPNNLGRSAN